MKRCFTLAAALLISLSAAAQSLTLPTIDAVALGMGNVTMATIHDGHSLYNNAAMTAFALYPMRLSSSYYGQADFDYYAVSGYWRFDMSNTLQVGWRQYLREKGNRDSALDVGYTRRLNDEWAIGVVGRYMHLKRYDETTDALAVDLSVGWQRPIANWERYSTLRVGAKIANLGGFLDHTDDHLPLSAKAGVSLETFFSDAHALTVGADVGYYFSPSEIRGLELGLGAEYNLMQLIRLRAGYHAGDDKLFNPSYGSVGVGVSILHLRCDFAYLIASKSTPLHNCYSISFGLDF